LFDYPADIRKAIYTTNAIESLNSVIRKATRQRKIFPTDGSVMKVIYLAMEKEKDIHKFPINLWMS
ncbi:transposase, partial [Endozoicomonas sp.]|uniref:transposase n=1 Tax=Endozoicomonas sp. TaxID=1892382 RepID=UPI00383A3A74